MHTFSEIAQDSSLGSVFDRLVGDCFCSEEFSLQNTALYAAAEREDYTAMALIAKSQIKRMREEYERKAS